MITLTLATAYVILMATFLVLSIEAAARETTVLQLLEDYLL